MLSLSSYYRKPEKDLSQSLSTQSDNAAKAQVVRQDFKGLDLIEGEGVVLIGQGTNLQGDVTNCNIVDIQGVLEGNVSAKVVIVRNGGGFRGSCVADHAEIHGVVEGEVIVHGLLDVRSNGQVAGNVTYEQLSVAVGARVSGQLETPAAVAATYTEGASGTNPTASDASRDSHYENTAISPPNPSKSNGAFLTQS